MAGVPQLLRDLDDDAFSVRENAKMELARLGQAAEPATRQALAKSSSLEMRRRRLEQLLKDVEANRQAPSGGTLRELRVVETLEQTGVAEAREALKALASGAPADSALALEAQAALKRLERR